MTSILVIFFGYVSSNKGNKNKNKQIIYQTKKLLHGEGNSQQNERTDYWMEKIFTNYMSVKGLIFKIYKELIHLNIRKTTNQIKNWQSNWIDIFQRRHTEANRHMKRYSTSLIMLLLLLLLSRFSHVWLCATP